MRIDNNYIPIVTPDPIGLISVKDLDRIKLNVGGLKFETSADTLKKYESFFSHLLTSDIPQKVDANNYIFIDRDGTHFGEILNFMRNNTIDFGDNVKAAKAIRMEADFYQLQELIQKCDEFLASPMAYFATYSRGIYTAEERQCMIQTGKPIVLLYLARLGIKDNLIPQQVQPPPPVAPDMQQLQPPNANELQIPAPESNDLALQEELTKLRLELEIEEALKELRRQKAELNQ